MHEDGHLLTVFFSQANNAYLTWHYMFEFCLKPATKTNESTNVFIFLNFPSCIVTNLYNVVLLSCYDILYHIVMYYPGYIGYSL